LASDISEMWVSAILCPLFSLCAILLGVRYSRCYSRWDQAFDS